MKNDVVRLKVWHELIDIVDASFEELELTPTVVKILAGVLFGKIEDRGLESGINTAIDEVGTDKSGTSGNQSFGGVHQEGNQKKEEVRSPE